MPSVFTKRKEGFAQSIVSGMSQADAYRKNYNAKGMADKTIHEAASRLMRDSKVAARIAELNSKIEEKFIEGQLWSREIATDRYLKVAKIAELNNKTSDMISAYNSLDNIWGIKSPNKHEMTGANGGTIQYSVIERVIVDPTE